jgi:signal transduction histidine kinase
VLNDLRNYKSFLRSFSFRAGVLIFFAFLAILLSLRLLIYGQAINTTRDGIKEIILAHKVELQQSVERYGMNYVKEYILAILEDTHDEHLILSLMDNDEVIGNLPEWPDSDSKGGWVEFEMPRTNNTPMQVMGNITNYPKNRKLMVGYDLSRLEIMEKALWMALIQNALLSFVAAFLLTFLVIFLLNKNMQKLNKTCTEVTLGNSKHRVKLSGANDEFEHLGRNLNAMIDRNEILLATVKDSTNALAHDMRTPLSRLRIKLQRLLEKQNLTNELQKDITEAVVQTDGLVEMFENILKIAKAENRIETEMFCSFNLSDLLNDIIDFYATFFEDKKQTVTTYMQDGDIMFRGDRQLVSQAIVNLLDNAVKYTPKNGKIDITLERTSNGIICSFADSGPGIPEEFREKVKERFFRMDASRNTEGTGLGMSLVDAVAKLHHGELRLEDNMPQGLKISLIFPG